MAKTYEGVRYVRDVRVRPKLAIPDEQMCPELSGGL